MFDIFDILNLLSKYPYKRYFWYFDKQNFQLLLIELLTEIYRTFVSSNGVSVKKETKSFKLYLKFLFLKIEVIIIVSINLKQSLKDKMSNLTDQLYKDFFLIIK